MSEPGAGFLEGSAKTPQRRRQRSVLFLDERDLAWCRRAHGLFVAAGHVPTTKAMRVGGGRNLSTPY